MRWRGSEARPSQLDSQQALEGTADADRILRLSARFIGIGYLFYAVMLVPHILGDSVQMDWWWTPLAVVLVFGPGVVLGIASLSGSALAIRRIAVVAGACYLVPAILWPLAWKGDPLLEGTWISYLPALAAMSIAIAVPAAGTLSYLLVAIVAVQWSNQMRAPSVNLPFALEFAYSFGFSLVFVAATLMAIRTGRLLDETRAETEASAAAAASMRARESQRRAYAGLLHDWVMSTLLFAARNPTSAGLRAQAVTAVDKLDRIGHEFSMDPFGAQAAAAFLRSAVTDVDADIAVTIRIPSEARSTEFDAEAIHAAAAGITESVRNSRSHAGADAECRVDIVFANGGFDVAVADDGRGFEISGIGPDRFGVASSVHRLADVAGGKVVVESSEGRGTVVRLTWFTPSRKVDDRPADVRTLLGMRTRAAWLVAIAFQVGITALAIMNHPPGSAVWPTVVVVVFDFVSVAALLVPHGDPLPLPATLWITVTSPIGAAIVILLDPEAFSVVSTLWPGSATAAIFAFLCVRGRTWFAWLGQAAIGIVCGVWSLATDQGFAVGFVGRLADFAPLLMATFFAYTLRPAAGEIYRLREESTRRVAARAAAVAAIHEGQRQLERLDELARTLLVRIASDEPLSGDDQRAARLLEAHLRATLRAPGLVHPLLTHSVERARQRGIEVLLYDERGLDDAGEVAHHRLLQTVAAEVDRVDTGTIRVRISPPRREIAATFVAVSVAGTRRIEFDNQGFVLDPEFGTSEKLDRTMVHGGD